MKKLFLFNVLALSMHILVAPPLNINAALIDPNNTVVENTITQIDKIRIKSATLAAAEKEYQTRDGKVARPANISKSMQLALAIKKQMQEVRPLLTHIKSLINNDKLLTKAHKTNFISVIDKLGKIEIDLTNIAQIFYGILRPQNTALKGISSTVTDPLEALETRLKQLTPFIESYKPSLLERKLTNIQAHDARLKLFRHLLGKLHYMFEESCKKLKESALSSDLT